LQGRPLDARGFLEKNHRRKEKNPKKRCFFGGRAMLAPTILNEKEVL
jgi:hypothetical protein